MLANEAGAAILFGSVVTRLVDFAPFASAHREDLGGADLARWRRHYRRGSAHLARGDFAAAASEFEAALRVDDQHAETHFRLGRAYWESGDRDRGKTAFVSARDLDTLRFRADSTINAIIEAVASNAATARVGFVDVVDAAPDELTEGELLLDHVHFSSAGNDWLARSFYGAVVEIISNERGTRPRPVSMTSEALSNAVFDVPPVRVSGLENLKRLVSKPPFTARFENDVLVANIKRRIDGLRSTRFRLTDELKRSLAEEPDNFVNYWLAQEILVSELEEAAAAGDAAAFERTLASLHEFLAIRGDNADLNARREKALRAISDYAASQAPGA
jgi:tetratricopeptide (TPR) repeat protein